jgi:hypothetical protein
MTEFTQHPPPGEPNPFQKDDHTPLPPRWEQKVDGQGQTYYIDDYTRSTTWIRPSPESISAYTSVQPTNSPPARMGLQTDA